MDRATVLKLLAEHSDELRSRFVVRRPALFGSAARDELREDSDIDVLVAFEGAPTFDGYFDRSRFSSGFWAGRSIWSPKAASSRVPGAMSNRI